MNKEAIIENLEIIGIKFKSQLEENDIHFWWQKKYTEILKSDLENKNELLISLNNALEDLEKVNITTIKSKLKTQPTKKKRTQSRKTIPNNNTTPSKDKKFITSEDWKNDGDHYVNNLDYKKGIYCYTKALEIDKNYFDAYLNRGICHQNLKEYTSALSDFDIALKLRPDNNEIYLLRGKTNHYLKIFKNAIADLDQYIKSEKSNAEAFFLRGNAKFNTYFLGSKNFLSAYDDYLEGYELYPGYADNETRENFNKVKEIILSSSEETIESESEKRLNLDNDTKLRSSHFISNVSVDESIKRNKKDASVEEKLKREINYKEIYDYSEIYKKFGWNLFLCFIAILTITLILLLNQENIRDRNQRDKFPLEKKVKSLKTYTNDQKNSSGNNKETNFLWVKKSMRFDPSKCERTEYFEKKVPTMLGNNYYILKKREIYRGSCKQSF